MEHFNSLRLSDLNVNDWKQPPTPLQSVHFVRNIKFLGSQQVSYKATDQNEFAQKLIVEKILREHETKPGKEVGLFTAVVACCFQTVITSWHGCFKMLRF